MIIFKDLIHYCQVERVILTRRSNKKREQFYCSVYHRNIETERKKDPLQQIRLAGCRVLWEKNPIDCWETGASVNLLTAAAALCWTFYSFFFSFLKFCKKQKNWLGGFQYKTFFCHRCYACVERKYPGLCLWWICVSFVCLPSDDDEDVDDTQKAAATADSNKRLRRVSAKTNCWVKIFTLWTHLCVPCVIFIFNTLTIADANLSRQFYKDEVSIFGVSFFKNL